MVEKKMREARGSDEQDTTARHLMRMMVDLGEAGAWKGTATYCQADGRTLKMRVKYSEEEEEEEEEEKARDEEEGGRAGSGSKEGKGETGMQSLESFALNDVSAFTAKWKSIAILYDSEIAAKV